MKHLSYIVAKFEGKIMIGYILV